MGTLHYDGQGYPFEDRTLAHLQVIIGVKLRRAENFVLTWVVPAANGGGRHSIWVDNGVPIVFRYASSKIPSINRDWIETLATSAGSTTGMIVTAEGTILPVPGEHGFPLE